MLTYKIKKPAAPFIEDPTPAPTPTETPTPTPTAEPTSEPTETPVTTSEPAPAPTTDGGGNGGTGAVVTANRGGTVDGATDSAGAGQTSTPPTGDEGIALLIVFPVLSAAVIAAVPKKRKVK